MSPGSRPTRRKRSCGSARLAFVDMRAKAGPALCVNVSACDSTEGAEVGGFILDDLEVVSREHIIKG